MGLVLLKVARLLAGLEAALAGVVTSVLSSVLSPHAVFLVVISTPNYSIWKQNVHPCPLVRARGRICTCTLARPDVFLPDSIHFAAFSNLSGIPV